MSLARHAQPRVEKPAAGPRIPHGWHSRVGLSLVPAVVLFTTFFAIPLLVLVVTAFSRWGGTGFELTGVANFRRLFADPVFYKATGNTLFYCLASVVIQVPLGVGFAMILSLHVRGWKFLRAVIFIPFVISGAAYALVFAMFYNPSYGLLNNMLNPIGGGRDWLFDTATARWAVAGTFVFIIGFAVVVVMSEIASIPAELYEAAEVDGASLAQRQRYITLPLLRNVVGTVILIRLLVDIGMFDIVYILTSGGPDNATVTLSLYAFRAYTRGEWGYANAAGAVIVVLGAILIVSVRRIFRIGERP